MWKHIRSVMLLAVFGGAVPVGLSMTTAEAGWFCHRCQRSHYCQRHAANCNCKCNCQTQQPCVETQMVPQQTLTYRNQVVTQYRQEAITQNVPVTTYQNVTVDEGGYQMVYVPKPVTKQVPQVVYQPQTSYRTVPFQVVQQVPQMVTQMVPRQVIRQQPSTLTSCGPCGGHGFATAPMMTSPMISAPVNSNPVTMLAPVTVSNPTVAHPTVTHPSGASHSAPVPDPRFIDGPGAAKPSWTTVGSRYGSSDNTARNRDSDSQSSSNVRFKPARTVYKSWESQSQNAASQAPPRN